LGGRGGGVGRRDGEDELPRWPGGCGSLELEGEAERKRKIKIKQGSRLAREEVLVLW